MISSDRLWKVKT